MNCDNACSRKSAAANECLQRYGNEMEFMRIFNPDKQIAYCADVRRCLTGNAPTLKVFAEAYSVGTAESWLMIQFSDLSEYCGTKEKMSTKQIEELSRVVCCRFPMLKVSEVMLFCVQYKAGDFGRFFGSVDALTVAASLKQFVNDCEKLKHRYYEEDEHEQRVRKDALHQKEVDKFRALLRRHSLTMNEYLKHNDLFKASLTDEQIDAELSKRRAREKDNSVIMATN